MMKDVKNSAGKLVCRVDADAKLVEIVHKGLMTTIRFLPNGEIEEINSAVIKATS